MKKRFHVWIYGIVKGVFFRHNLKIMAEKLGIKGWCRNTDEGVEAVFEGEHEKLKEMLDFCRKGPVLARVEKVETKEETYEGKFEDFRILYF